VAFLFFLPSLFFGVTLFLGEEQERWGQILGKDTTPGQYSIITLSAKTEAVEWTLLACVGSLIPLFLISHA